MVKAVIFDMDGLLIDSEPLWKEVEIQEFAAVGLHLTDAMLRQLGGRKETEVVDYLYRHHPWSGPTPAEMHARIITTAHELVMARGRALPGAIEAVRLVAGAGLPVAIASSSEASIIEAVVDKFDLRPYLKVIQSADSEPYGKPHPGVYLTAARELGVHPQDCLAIEDSPTGVLSAKAASMKCLAVPEAGRPADPRLAIADHILPSLADFTLDLLKTL